MGSAAIKGLLSWEFEPTSVGFEPMNSRLKCHDVDCQPMEDEKTKAVLV